MTCYAIGLLRNVEMGPAIRTYLAEIDATLRPFDGRFIIHGGEKRVLEGRADDDLIVIAFPDGARARDWYHSAAYRRIVGYAAGQLRRRGVPRSTASTRITAPRTSWRPERPAADPDARRSATRPSPPAPAGAARRSAR